MQDVMAPPSRSASRSPLGFLLVIPAALLALATLVVPSVQTVWHSLNRMSVFGKSSFDGLHNYRILSDHLFWHALGYSLALGLIPLVTAVVVAPLLAAALDRSNSVARRTAGVAISIPLVLFSPVAAAVSWVIAKQRDHLGSSIFPRPSGRPWPVALMSSAAVFGAVCGLGLLVFLAVMRSRRHQSPAAHRNTLAAVILLMIITTFAMSLQAFTFGATAGDSRTETLNGLQFQRAFELFDFGGASAISTVLGILLGVLGVGAVLVALSARLRIDLTPAQAQRTPGRNSMAGIAALVLVLVVILVTMWPWLTIVFRTAHIDGSTSKIYLNTWGPAIIGAFVSVGVAYLAALGIGGLRPLGERSEWLLLPFAPWLFVGIGPLAATDFLNLRHLHQLNTFVAVIPPILVSVPALVILTLFVSSRSAVWRNSPGASFASVVVAPTLPLAAFLAGATVLVNSQRLLWPEIIAPSQDHQTAPVAVVAQVQRLIEGGGPVGLTTPLLVVVAALAVMAALQILYFDRTVIVSVPVRAPQPTGFGPGRR